MRNRPGRRAAATALAAALIVATAPAAADYATGMKAYNARDYAAALREWDDAARAGDAQAMYRLGQLHEGGKGVPRNFVEAYRWYNLAAAQGIRPAGPARDRLERQMTVAQVAEAQARSTESEAGAPATSAVPPGPEAAVAAPPVPVPAPSAGDAALERAALQAVAARDWARSLPLLRALTAAQPDNQLAWFYLARAGLNLGGTHGHIDALDKAAKGPNESIRRHAQAMAARLTARFRAPAEIGAETAKHLDRSPYARSNRDAKISKYSVVSQEAANAAYTITQDYRIVPDPKSIPGFQIEDGVVTIAGSRSMQAVTQSISFMNGLVELYKRHEGVGPRNLPVHEVRFEIAEIGGTWPFWENGGTLRILGTRSFVYAREPGRNRTDKVAMTCHAQEIDKTEPLPAARILGVDIQDRESRLFLAECRDELNRNWSYEGYLDTAIGVAVPGSFSVGARSQGVVTTKAVAE